MTEEHQQDEPGEDGATAFVMSLFTKDGPDLSGDTPASRMNVQMIEDALKWASDQERLSMAEPDELPGRHGLMEQAARDLAIDAGKHVDELKRAFDVAAPAPIPWDFARQQYAAGRWHLLANDGAAALITHSGIAGHKSTSIVALAGVLGECDPLVAGIEAAARAAGSSMVVYIGRRGWSRAFPGYEERAVIGVKEL